MKRSETISFVALGVAVIALFLVFAQTNSITGSVINENQVEEVPDQIEEEIPTKNTLGPEDLIPFTANLIQDHFPEVEGAFVNGKTIEETHDESCTEIFPNSCSSWHFPYEGTFRNKIYSNIYDFGEKEAPSIADILETQNNETEIEKITLIKGDALIEEHTKPVRNSRLYLLEISIPCQGRYWIKVGLSKWESNNAEEKGKIIEIANTLMNTCSN